jgi:protein-S-isoprenylcysteine O-methyltransferase Ste14
MFLRALVAVLVLPGIVAFAIPLLLLRPSLGRGHVLVPGVMVLALGLLLLATCVREFYVVGRGTLAPWAPPNVLVTSGPYRWSRNPMYVLLVVVGWGLVFASVAIGFYALGLAVLFHVRVVYSEEPWLERRYGDDWRAYARGVRRWLLWPGA